MDDWNYGDTPSEPVIACTPQSDGIQMVEYKAKGGDDSAYSITKPRDMRDYVVRVIYDEW